MTPTTPHVSIVLSTWNRGALLADAIQRLLALDASAPSHEIITVDNNSTDDTRALVERMIPASGGRLRYLFEPKQGVAYGRNAGAAASSGTIVAFTDDDVRVSPQWLGALVAPFADPAVSYAGGRVLPIWPAPPPAWFTQKSHGAPLALVDYGDQPRRIDARHFKCLVSANLAVRREVFEQFGGFDPRHQHLSGAVSACEDHELEVRLLRAGHEGRYVPDAIIHAEVQPRRLTKAYHRRWHFDHGRAMVRMTPPGYIFDGSCDFRPMRPDAKRLRGVPLYLTRSVMASLGQAVRHKLRRDDERAFWWECQGLEQAGAIHYFARGARGPD